MTFPGSSTIVDVALRDGLQIQSQTLPTDTKMALLDLLLAAGVRSMEVGSFVQPRLVPTMADTAEVCRRLPAVPDAEFIVLVPNLKGAQRALDAGVRDVRVVLSASEGHSRANTNRSVREGIEQTRQVREMLTAAGIAVTAGIATSFVCPFDGMITIDQLRSIVGELVDMGFEEVSLADTLGKADPGHVGDAVATMRQAFPRTTFSLHLHNTYGMGLANVTAGLQHGVSIFDSAIGGIGGCPFAPGAAGNIATEDVVFMLHAMGIETGIDIDALANAASELHRALASPLESAVSRALGWAS